MTALAAPQLNALADPKLRRFALWGAAGCFLGALIGQLFLEATRARTVSDRRAVSLLIDCSGSMLIGGSGAEGGVGQKLHEVKTAAADFVSRHRSPDDRIGVIGFGRSVHRAAPLTDDAQQLKDAIAGLFDGGGTAMGPALEAAANQLGDLPDDWREGVTRSILLFTDGMPDNQTATLTAARNSRQAGLRIVAIGTGDADIDFLAQVTGDRKLVFHVGAGDFAEGFRQAEQAIYGGSLVESGGGRESVGRSLMRSAIWGLLAACGMSLALVAGQNRYVHRAALSGKEAVAASLGGAAAGVCGAAAGQMLFSLANASASLPGLGALAAMTIPLARVASWSVMGLLSGWGLSWFVPNLQGSRAAIGGALGGAVGGVAFLVLSPAGDFLGAVLGAAILGAAIGMMLAWIEAAFRQAWLEVHYGGKEVINVSLGAQPVKIGGDNRACQVYARGARPLACQYTFADGAVHYVDFATEKSTTVEVGHEQEIGGVRVIVRGSRALHDAAAPAVRPTRIEPPPPPKIARPSAAAPPDALPPDGKTPARTLTAPPPPPRKTLSPAPPAASPSSSPPAAESANPAQPGTRVIRPVPPPPPPPRKTE